MKFRLVISSLTMLLGALVCVAQPQVDIPTALVKSSRVVVLPFANYSGAQELRHPLTQAVREWLIGHGIELADSARVAEVLREHRIRNTSELSVPELQILSQDLDAAYAITGSAHHLVVTPEISEFSLVSYMVYIPEARVDWCNSAVFATGGTRTLFSGPAESDTLRIIERAVDRLFRKLDFPAQQQRTRVTAIRSLPRHRKQQIPCDRIAVVPLSNETSTPFAGEFLTDHITAALFRRGFSVIFPGRVRQSMLEVEDLARGQTSGEVLTSIATSCGAEIVLTGSISDMTSISESRFGDIPSLNAELRLIQVQSGSVLWAKSIALRGDDSERLFGVGVHPAAGALARRAASAAVKAIPVVRKRVSQS